MIVDQREIRGFPKKVTVAQYSSPRDFVRTAKAGVKQYKYYTRTDWAGGTFDKFERGMTGGVLDYCEAAKDKVSEFSNVALADYDIDYEYNTTYGVLDYGAMVAGNPACMYGRTFIETDKSPIEIYVDTWTQASIKPAEMERKGIAILALVQALQVFRPVHVYLTKGSKFSPKGADTIQMVSVPTQPIDLARASFMLCSPTVNRWGMLSAIQAVHKSDKACPSPTMSSSRWQENELPSWVAEQHGVHDYLFIGLSASRDIWRTDESTIAWIKQQIEKFVGKINA